MTNYSKRTSLETKTHELFGDYLKDDNNWSPHTALVASVFRAEWASSLPADRIARIGSALANLQSDFDPKPILSRLVRAKILRTRRIAGVTHYEVNY